MSIPSADIPTLSGVIPGVTGTPLENQHGRPAWEVALLYPAQGDWSEADYLELDANTNHLIELVDGFLEVLPMPFPFHQLIVKFLFQRIEEYVEHNTGGTVLFAPLPVHLGPQHYREPDIVYLRAGRLANVRKHPEGADLVVEVVSEGEKSRERDLETKPIAYARAGIEEYWIVDPEQQEIQVLVLDGQRYRLHGKFGRGETAHSVLLAGFQVAVDDVFAAGETAT